MNNDEMLQKEAERIKKELVRGADSITLDKRSLEKSTKQSPSHKNASKNLQTDKEPKTDIKKSSEEQPKLAGYKLSDIVRAPDHPPELVEPDSYHETSNKKVRILVSIGTLICLLGIILVFVVSVILGLLLVAVGSVMILFSVFAHVT